MQITRVRYTKVDMGITRPYAVTYVLHDQIENMFVQIELADGTRGIGSGSSSIHVTGEEMSDDYVAVEAEVGEILVGEDICEHRSLIRTLRTKLLKRPALLAALDMALYDAYCKYLDISLGRYLGQVHKSLPTSITIGLKSVEETIIEGQEYRDRGFQVIKLKIGSNQEEDVERTLRLREVIGHHSIIRVDANQGYTVEEFRKYVRLTKSANVEFYEQPLQPSMNDDMLKFTEAERAICAADESLHHVQDAIELLQIGQPFGIFNIKIMKAGGVTEGLRIADFAEASGTSLMWGCMDESVVSISASLNAAFSSPATKYIDLDGSFDLGADPASGGFILDNGIMSPASDLPGLGVSLKEDIF